MVLSDAFCVIFDEIYEEEEQGCKEAGKSHIPRHAEGVGGREREDTAVVEETEQNYHGVVEEMGADVDKHGPRIEKEIAQHKAQEETGDEAVEVAMGKGEDEGGNNDGRMGAAEPAVEDLLHTATEEEFLADGGEQRHNEQLEQEVGDGGEGEHLFDLGLGEVGEPAHRRLKRSQVPAIVPGGDIIIGGSDEQHDDHAHRSQTPVASLPMELEIVTALRLEKECEQARGQQEIEQLGEGLLHKLEADGGIATADLGDEEHEATGNNKREEEEKKKPYQLAEGLLVNEKNIQIFHNWILL